VVERFFPQGEVVGATPRYFLKDHLGSIRAVAESDGSISMQYDYWPWGEQSVISETTRRISGSLAITQERDPRWLLIRFTTRSLDARSAAIRLMKRVGSIYLDTLVMIPSHLLTHMDSVHRRRQLGWPSESRQALF
jgi:hypothetical protein